MDDTDALERRLRALGQEPVPAETARTQLAALSTAVPPAARGRWAHKVKVGAAFLAGLLLGGTGLAAAGALPDPAQGVAHDALGAVGIGVPDRNTDDCTLLDGEFANHGQYVKAVGQADGDKHAAARSDCGKPLGAEGPDDEQGDGAQPANRSECAPPWAGQGKPAWAGVTEPEERQALKDAAQAEKDAWVAPEGCADDDPGEVGATDETGDNGEEPSAEGEGAES